MRTTERQRKRKMALGLFTAGVALIVTVGLATAGSILLLNGSSGKTVESSDLSGPVRRLPESYTALIGVTNDAGRITSVVALALNPDGTGGAIMPLSASADVGAGRTETLRPLSASVAQQGPESFRRDSESISNISFDMAEIVDAARFEELFGPVGTIEVTLGTPVTDTETGKSWAPDEYTLGIGEAAELVTATNLYVQDWYHDAARYAVWRGIATASQTAGGDGAAATTPSGAANSGAATSGAANSVAPTSAPAAPTTGSVASSGSVASGASAGGSTPPGPGGTTAAPGNMDEFISRLLAGPVQERGLGIIAVDDSRVAEELDPDLSAIYGTGGVPSVVVHDSSEAALVGSAVAPGRLGAPIDAARYRLVVAFDSTDLEGRNFTLAQAAREAVDRLSFSKVNIPSVVLFDEPGRDVTLVEVAREEDLETARAQAEKMFGGQVEARVAPQPIVGIDVEIFLGRPYLETVVGPLTDYVGPNTMELNSGQPLSESPAPTTTTTLAPPTTTSSEESTVSDSTDADDAETDGTDADDAESDSSETDGTDADGTESDSSEADVTDSGGDGDSDGDATATTVS